MKTFLLLATTAAISGAAMIGSAAAMPTARLDTNAQPAAANSIQKVHWVCGPYRCWWRPNYYNYYAPRYYNYYGPRGTPITGAAGGNQDAGRIGRSAVTACRQSS